MRQKPMAPIDGADKMVGEIKRATRRSRSPEDKIWIVIAGIRGEESIAELCRKKGTHQNLYYQWSKEFLEAGKKRLAGDTLSVRHSIGRTQTLFWSSVSMADQLPLPPRLLPLKLIHRD